MNRVENSRLPQLAAPAYLTSVYLLLLPLINLVSSVWPVHAGAYRWRFGAVGLLSGALLEPLLGLLVALGVSLALDHARMQRVVSIVAAVMSVLVLIALGVFSLDTLQLRREIRAEALPSFKTAAVKAAVIMLMMAVAMAVVALSAHRAARRSKAEEAQRKVDPQRHAIGPIVGRMGVAPSSSEAAAAAAAAAASAPGTSSEPATTGT